MFCTLFLVLKLWIVDLYLLNGCIPFDKMPFIYSPLYHNPRLGALFEAINPKGREHELLARQIKNNTEISGRIFTPVSELEHYGDVPALANTYYYKLWFGHRERSQIIVNNGFAYINEYKLDTCNIIDKLMTLSKKLMFPPFWVYCLKQSPESGIVI